MAVSHGLDGGIRIQITEVYCDWIKGLNGRTARMQVRGDKITRGNPYQHRKLTEGVSELKIDVGPGYLVDYTERNGELIVLLVRGDKTSQQDDLKAAIALARNLEEYADDQSQGKPQDKDPRL